jgi:[acyl-carrier-protein] S-malonyltransferase
MTLGYLFGAAISDADPDHGKKLYEAFPAMRDVFTQVQEWTGIDSSHLLLGDFGAENGHRKFALNGIRLAALALGINDILAESDVRPGAVGGISLGGLVSSCVAGAVSREDFFRFLVQETRTESPDLPPQGSAIALVSPDEDLSDYYGESRPGVYLAGDLGVLARDSTRILMFSGTRQGLDGLLADFPAGKVSLIEGQSLAVHSPLRQHAADFIAACIGQLPLSDPAIPVCSSLEQRTLRTAAEIRDMFLRNRTSMMCLPDVCREMRSHDVQLALVLGPTLPVGALKFPFPVVRIAEPEDIAGAFTAIYEYGVEIPR